MASDGSDKKRFGSMLRNTWQKMNDWGDEFERRHFDGDLLGKITEGPKKVGQAMNDWGDDFERRHFDGDFVGAVTAGPKKVGQAVNSRLDDMERRHFNGDFVGTVAGAGSQVAAELLAEVSEAAALVSEATAYVADAGEGVDSEGFRGGGVASVHQFHVLNSQTELPSHKTDGSEGEHAFKADDAARSVSESEKDVVRIGTTSNASSSSAQPIVRHAASIDPAAHASDDEFTCLPARIDSLSNQESLDAAADLRQRLENEENMRHGRAQALRALALDIRELPKQIAEERRLSEVVSGERAAAAARTMAASRALHALKNNHRSLQERHEAQIEELEQLEAAADAALAASTRAELLMSGSSPNREWARDGPETDALKEAKITLALLLTQVDEARLAKRKELAGLNNDMEVLERETQILRRGSAAEASAGSFRESLKRLFRVAAGREDGSA
eukprot:TRINITY_DN19400_c0_g1_i1.p1 TRINITY_DN19400_c0_g1~~TRINITY_DN19400_c0_g1_i1.p1  ORF type:complete len:457 (+),score=116.37 TRINITY_DN19400_c0_g1_i1:30-1373(+)